MAYDPTLPTDVQKIRDLGTVIRPNWVAIQDGQSSFKPKAVNLNDRTVAGVPVDPTAIADAFIVYAKTDTAGNTEMFGINENSGVIQFTQGTPVINSTQSSIFLPGGLTLKTGTSSFVGNNLTLTVSFSAAFPNAFFGANFTLINTPTPNSVGTSILSSTAAQFIAVRSSSVVFNQSFYWMAWGN